jgi:hypothetical protein
MAADPSHEILRIDLAETYRRDMEKKERIGIIISIQIFCIILILNKNVSRDALLLWPALTAVNAAYMLRDIRRQERDK